VGKSKAVKDEEKELRKEFGMDLGALVINAVKFA
jgi:hypothetical protein